MTSRRTLCTLLSFTSLPHLLLSLVARFVMICMDSNEKWPRGTWARHDNKLRVAKVFSLTILRRLGRQTKTKNTEKAGAEEAGSLGQAPALGCLAWDLPQLRSERAKELIKSCLVAARIQLVLLASCNVSNISIASAVHRVGRVGGRGRGRGVCIEAGHTAVCLAAIACILFAYNLPVYGRQEFHIPSPLSTPPSLFAFAVRACVKGEEEG